MVCAPPQEPRGWVLGRGNDGSNHREGCPGRSHFVLAHAVLWVKGGSVRVYDQDIREAEDVSAYDRIDFEITATSNRANGVAVDTLTAMQNKIDGLDAGLGIPSWYSLGTKAVAATAGVSAIKALSLLSDSGWTWVWRGGSTPMLQPQSHKSGDPLKKDDQGIGVPMFLTMKKMIAAMMVISGSPLSLDVDNFMRNA